MNPLSARRALAFLATWALVSVALVVGDLIDPPDPDKE